MLKFYDSALDLSLLTRLVDKEKTPKTIEGFLATIKGFVPRFLDLKMYETRISPSVSSSKSFSLADFIKLKTESKEEGENSPGKILKEYDSFVREFYFGKDDAKIKSLENTVFGFFGSITE